MNENNKNSMRAKLKEGIIRRNDHLKGSKLGWPCEVRPLAYMLDLAETGSAAMAEDLGVTLVSEVLRKRCLTLMAFFTVKLSYKIK